MCVIRMRHDQSVTLIAWPIALMWRSIHVKILDTEIKGQIIKNCVWCYEIVSEAILKGQIDAVYIEAWCICFHLEFSFSESDTRCFHARHFNKYSRGTFPRTFLPGIFLFLNPSIEFSHVFIRKSSIPPSRIEYVRSVTAIYYTCLM